MPDLLAAQHRGSTAHHCLERVGSLVRAVLLPEAQQAAEADHGHDDDDLGQVGVVCFSCTDRQPVVGDEADPGQGQQYIDERVVQGLEQLHQGVGLRVVGNLVGPIVRQALGGFVLGQALFAGIEVGEGDRQAIARFTGGAGGQAGFAFGLGR